MQDQLLAAGLGDQPQTALGQVPQTSVQQAAGPAAGAEGQVELLDQGRAQAAHGGIAGDARPDDPPADYQHVERTLLQAVGKLRPRQRWVMLRHGTLYSYRRASIGSSREAFQAG